MTYGSIRETGVEPGGFVRCVSVRDGADIGVRYTPGRDYRVVEWLGRPCVESNGHGKKCGIGNQLWLLPFDDYGAQWEACAGA